MKNSTLVIGIVIALIVGTGAGYVFGKGSNDNNGDAKKLQDATTMMREQSANIKEMADMMTSGGVALQEMGMKAKDDAAVATGKDLEAVGKKYVEENAKAVEKDSSMKGSM